MLWTDRTLRIPCALGGDYEVRPRDVSDKKPVGKEEKEKMGGDACGKNLPSCVQQPPSRNFKAACQRPGNTATERW